MKKLYMLGLLLVAASTAGCTLKAPTVPELTTGDVQEVTGTTKVIPEIPSSAMEEFTGEFDSGTVPMLSGSDKDTAEQSGVNAEVKDLINKRKTQSGDETKLTEEDIGLMEQIIQKVQDLGK